MTLLSQVRLPACICFARRCVHALTAASQLDPRLSLAASSARRQEESDYAPLLPALEKLVAPSTEGAR